MPEPTPERARRRSLLTEIRRLGGHITTGQAHAYYRATGHGPCRTTARRDLQHYTRRGVLTASGPDNARTYHLLLTTGQPTRGAR